MNRDFLLVFAGGMVSLVTSLVVLFVADFIRQRGELLKSKRIMALPNPESNTWRRSEFFKSGAASADATRKDAGAAEAKPSPGDGADAVSNDAGVAEAKPSPGDGADAVKKEPSLVMDSSRVVVKSDN